ncbi:MAG: AAC(3) family N-acetyltransferase [Acidobacteria bacterium]|nr:AAC(3) family N-acetyltransferase [Acidobacteriota bacterium]
MMNATAIGAAHEGTDLGRLSQTERHAWNMILGIVGDDVLAGEQGVRDKAREQTAVSPYLGRILSLADGRRDLLDILHLIGHEQEIAFTTGEVGEIVAYFRSLSVRGKVEIRYRISVTADDVCHAARGAGVRAGDVVFVHSSLSALGQVIGGADAVITGLANAVKPGGLLAMPTFDDNAVIAVTDCGIQRRYPPNPSHISSPYDPRQSVAYTGVIPNAFWRRGDVLRSRHPTHSVAAFGSRAGWFVEGHGPDRSAFERCGPFGKIVDEDGCFLFLGVGLHSMTFLHVLEDWLELPYLPTATVRILEAGKERLATAPRYPEGHRCFYLPEPNALTRAVAESGIEFSINPLGLTEVQMVRARHFYDRLVPRMRRDPDLLLCDNQQCAFCTWAKRQMGEQPHEQVTTTNRSDSPSWRPSAKRNPL